MYSQNDEEKHITEYFKDNNSGKFIEIGGFNPFLFSNTRKLYENGWSGVVVEPSPACFEAFLKEYKDEPRMKLVNVAIHDHNGKCVFYDCAGDAVGTVDARHKKLWENGSKVRFNKIEVDCVTMADFLEEHGKGVDFLNLDVEGINVKLFYDIPDWFLSSIKMICIEHDGEIEHIKNRCVKFGFTEVCRNAENLILKK